MLNSKSKYDKYKFRLEKMNNWIWAFFRAVFICAVSFYILYPVIIKISLSFMTVDDIFDLTTVWIPRSLNLSNYIDTFKLMEYGENFLRTFSLSTVVSILQLIACSFIGYGLARYYFRGSNIIFALVIFTLVVPPQLIMIPLYLNFRYFDIFGLLGDKSLNLLGSYWPIILTTLTGMGARNGIFIYIFRQFFKGMPRDLEEAAYIDGAGPFKCFFVVMIPGAVPALVIVFLLSFVWQWNDTFFITLYSLDSTGLAAAIINIGDQLRSMGFYSDSDLIRVQKLSILLNTGMLLFSLPLVLLYTVMQKFFIESVNRTGIIG